MWSVIIIILAILLIWLVLKIYFEKHDTIIAYTGGLGSGKTFKGVNQSTKLLNKNRFIVKFNNIKNKILNVFRKEKKLIINEIPMLYSSIPIFIKQKSREFKLYNLVKLKYSFWVDYNKDKEDICKLDRYIKRQDFEKLKEVGVLTNSNVDKFIESSIELTEDYLLLQTHINYKSIVF